MHCHTCKSSKDDLIYESDYWIVLLHKSQGYIGRCMIDLKRHAESLSDLTKDEWEDFISLIKKLEAALKKSFMATTFNLTFMMNDAFQEKPYNPHVHWHLRARYDHDVEFEGITFKDPQFGKHYDRTYTQEISNKIRTKIIQKIKANI